MTESPKIVEIPNGLRAEVGYNPETNTVYAEFKEGDKGRIELQLPQVDFESQINPNRQIDQEAQDINNLSGREAFLMDVIRTGDLKLALENDFVIGRIDPPFSRGIELLDTITKQFYSLNGIGVVEYFDENDEIVTTNDISRVKKLKIRDFDMGTSVRDKLKELDPETPYGGTVYIDSKTGGFIEVKNNTDLGVIPYDHMHKKIQNTKKASEVWGDSVVVPEFIASGKFVDGRKTNNGQELGWYISRLPVYFQPHELSYASLNKNQDWTFNDFVLNYLKQKYSAIRKMHNAGMVHHQLTGTNVGISFSNTDGSIRSKALIKDFETLMDVSGYKTDEVYIQESIPQMSVSPKTLSFLQDLSMSFLGDVSLTVTQSLKGSNDELAHLFLQSLGKLAECYWKNSIDGRDKNLSENLIKDATKVAKLLPIDSYNLLIEAYSKTMAAILATKIFGGFAVIPEDSHRIKKTKK